MEKSCWGWSLSAYAILADEPQMTIMRFGFASLISETTNSVCVWVQPIAVDRNFHLRCSQESYLAQSTEVPRWSWKIVPELGGSRHSQRNIFAFCARKLKDEYYRNSRERRAFAPSLVWALISTPEYLMYESNTQGLRSFHTHTPTQRQLQPEGVIH